MLVFTYHLLCIVKYYTILPTPTIYKNAQETACMIKHFNVFLFHSHNKYNLYYFFNIQSLPPPSSNGLIQLKNIIVYHILYTTCHSNAITALHFSH